MRTFFQARLRREKLLLLLLAVALAVVVASHTAKEVAAFLRLDRKINEEVAYQRVTLQQRPMIEERAREAAAHFDASKTYDSLRLASEVDTLVKTVGIKNSSTGDAKTETSPGLSIHSLQLTVRNVDYPSLVKLYQQLVAHRPYIGIDQCTITAGTTNPTNPPLTAVFRLTAVEVSP